MRHCLWCDEPFVERITWNRLFNLSKDPPICEKCRQSLRFISGEICRYCGRMRERALEYYFHADVCHDCHRWESNPAWQGVLTKNRSLFVYNRFLKNILSRYKFRGDIAVIEAVRDDWQSLLKNAPADAVIVPIPLSSERLYERGFNQSLVLAQLLDRPLEDCLLRANHEEKQSKKTRTERLETREDIFKLKEGVNVRGKKVIVIDDIYTTGATIRHAARILLRAGAKSVSSYTLAR